jgi:hypothetical protein
MTTLAANTPARVDSYNSRKNLYKRIHTTLGKMGIKNESEQRNLFVAITGERSLRKMSIKQLTNTAAFLKANTNTNTSPTPKPAPKPVPYVSDEEAQSWLD